MTAGERLIQQGFEQARKELFEQGRREGECRALLLWLRQRFGSQVDEDVERRVEMAPSEVIGTWVDRIFSAATLSDLMGVRPGRQEIERGMLLRLLRKRFGSQVDGKVERCVQAASDQQFATWEDRIFFAATLAEIMAT
jgi:hypothetical protein